MTKPLPEIKRIPGIASRPQADRRTVYVATDGWWYVALYRADGWSVYGPPRKTQRGAINAWNRMMVKWGGK